MAFRHASDSATQGYTRFYTRHAKRSRKFPLWLHKSTGQRRKKLKQVNYYIDTDEAIALQRYRAEWDDIVAGSEPRWRWSR